MSGLARGLLLFVAGLLVGANVVYFLMKERPAPSPRAAVPAIESTPTKPQATPAATPPATDSRPPIPATPGATTRPWPATTLPDDALVIPVQGVRPTELQDTFDDARGGGRVHEALDIMAARGTPVLSATDGRIEKLFESVAGGHTIYAFDQDATHAYYYAHLDRYAPGIREGQPIERGEVIGYVGSTGNASEGAPHLHFAIFELGPQKKWWEGTAIDPLPLLATPR